MAEQTFSETQAAAARILLGHAKDILPSYPLDANATQVLVVQLLLDNAIALLPE